MLAIQEQINIQMQYIEVWNLMFTYIATQQYVVYTKNKIELSKVNDEILSWIELLPEFPLPAPYPMGKFTILFVE